MKVGFFLINKKGVRYPDEFYVFSAYFQISRYGRYPKDDCDIYCTSLLCLNYNINPIKFDTTAYR
jgi:hypothetical protein